MPEELKALESKVYAEALDKLLKIIDRLRERIHSDPFDTKKFRMSQSINSYGFYINIKQMYAWFGYIRSPLYLQAPYTPLYLQVRLAWITDDKVDKEKLSQKLQRMFKSDPTYEYVKAYPVSCLDDLDKFAEELRKDLGYLDDACRESV